MVAPKDVSQEALENIYSFKEEQRTTLKAFQTVLSDGISDASV